MDEWRILHCADLHLDTPFKGLRSRDEALAQRLEEASFRSLDRIVDHAFEQKVDALLIGGDSFDSSDPGLRARFALRDALVKLSEGGIPVFIVAGNHDPLPSWSEDLVAQTGTTLFGSEAPERRVLEKEGVEPLEILGISLPRAVVREKLALQFPDARPGYFSIALMHGTFGEAGSHHPYNPFTLEDVGPKAYDVWALGHIHQRGTPSSVDPLIHYPGVPQGRHPNEKGAKGCSLIRMQGKGKASIEFLPTHQVRYEELECEIPSIDSFEELEQDLEQKIRELRDSDDLILRLQLKGRSPLHFELQDPARIEDLKKQLTEPPSEGRAFCWIDRVEDRTWPDRDIQALRDRGDLVGELVRTFQSLQTDPSSMEETFDELQKEYGGSFLKMDDKALSETERKELLDRALWILLDAFLKEEEKGGE